MERRKFMQTILAAALPNISIEKKARIIFAGDTLLGGYYNSKYGTMLELVNKIDSIKEKQGLQGVINYYFKNINHLFKESDFSVLNLEGPITKRDSVENIQRKMVNKSIPLRQHEDTAKILKLAGIDLVSLANNHMYDYNNEEGLENTINSLEIDYIGAGLKENAYNYKLKEINGIKFAFLALSNILEPNDMLAKENKIGIAGIPEKSNFNSSKLLNYTLENLKEAKKHSDFTVMILHAGPIGGSRLNNIQIELSNVLIKNGIDVIIGSHSHSKQPIKDYENQLLFYGLGNFIFGGKRSTQSISTIPVIDFYLNGNKKEIKYKTYDIHPNNGDFVPRLVI